MVGKMEIGKLLDSSSDARIRIEALREKCIKDPSSSSEVLAAALEGYQSPQSSSMPKRHRLISRSAAMHLLH